MKLGLTWRLIGLYKAVMGEPLGVQVFQMCGAGLHSPYWVGMGSFNFYIETSKCLIPWEPGFELMLVAENGGLLHLPWLAGPQVESACTVFQFCYEEALGTP